MNQAFNINTYFFSFFLLNGTQHSQHINCEQNVLILAFGPTVAGVALIQIAVFSLASRDPGCDPSGNKANVFSAATPGAIIWSSGIDHSFSPPIHSPRYPLPHPLLMAKSVLNV